MKKDFSQLDAAIIQHIRIKKWVHPVYSFDLQKIAASDNSENKTWVLNTEKVSKGE